MSATRHAHHEHICPHAHARTHTHTPHTHTHDAHANSQVEDLLGASARAKAEAALLQKAIKDSLQESALSDKTKAKEQPLSSDLRLVGSWRTRQNVLEYGLRPIVARVQDGYSSYSQYEQALLSLIEKVQESAAAEIELGTGEGTAGAMELMKVACEIATMKTGTAICKSMAQPHWQAQRLFILQQNGWAGGVGDALTDGFAKKAKMLTVFQRISKPDGAGSSDSSDPFSRGGIFDQNSNRNARSRNNSRDATRSFSGSRDRGPDDRACHNCGERGHLARACPKRQRRTTDMVCHRCKEPGHTAARCDGERK